MVLVSEVKYETKVREFEDISPEAVLSMLRDVRVDIGKLDVLFLDAGLVRVLEVVEAGKYEMNGSVLTRIDLSSANGVVNVYRKYSEGGCQSCVSLGRETVDAQDGRSGWYCKISDPDYDKKVIGDSSRCKYVGFSPKVSKYHKTPCDSWKPTFSPPLEVLLKRGK